LAGRRLRALAVVVFSTVEPSGSHPVAGTTGVPDEEPGRPRGGGGRAAAPTALTAGGGASGGTVEFVMESAPTTAVAAGPWLTAPAAPGDAGAPREADTKTGEVSRLIVPA
jgi:hypothetical protein